MPTPLVFVYNADSGVLNGLRDLWVKTVAPERYDCPLCAVTYGPLGMHRRWRDFTCALRRDVTFLHRDELRAQYGLSGVPLPCAFELTPGGPRVWLSAEQLRAARTTDDLMALVRARAEQDR
ncbi:hypothetical protein [Deinococcus maricopensis]|uniref:GTPase n=1 Tax=Deinococcus maricopensis (strain DSM 21211 / LMG 22137 / NRRL B-23946 / LB-34) TaxID=709986 RepID=E8U7W6_DEIML|nr:hypothetical protein [Deinococcus maricopensis]ADV67155.1 hypothetical protein Deima_1506 [Deinococcus maricopensis DSM 21211]